MNKLLLGLLLLLSACNTYVRQQMLPALPGTYRAVGNTWAYSASGTTPLYTVSPGQDVTVIGMYRDWCVLDGGGRKVLLVPGAALLPGTNVQVDASLYYRPHRLATSYAPNYDSYYYGAVGSYGTPDHVTTTGPRGGQYYINGNGNKTYVTPPSTIYSQPVQTGPRGGQYYINSHGNKSYIKR